MAIEQKVDVTGTGQAGAGETPAGATKDIPIHIEGGAPVDNLARSADHAARKGLERQRRDDPSEFTK